MEEEKRSSYLEQPVAPTVEGGDDGGVYVATIQTLERSKIEEEERKGGQKEEILHYGNVYTIG